MCNAHHWTYGTPDGNPEARIVYDQNNPSGIHIIPKKEGLTANTTQIRDWTTQDTMDPWHGRNKSRMADTTKIAQKTPDDDPERISQEIHRLALEESGKTAELVGRFYQTLITFIPVTKWNPALTPESMIVQRLAEVYLHYLMGGKAT